MWYKTGTINLIANNATVTGTGTAWADAKFGVMPGMILLAPDNKLYEVKQVNSNTSLTLNSNYAGSTASGQSYAIITTYEGDISQFSARFAAMLTFFQGSRNDTVSWFTGSGDMTFTKDDGTTLTVPTLAKIQSDYISLTKTAKQTMQSELSTAGVLSAKGPAGYAPDTGKAAIGWNRENGLGVTDIYNHRGTGSGGWKFWGSSNSNPVPQEMASIDLNGTMILKGGLKIGTPLSRDFGGSGTASGAVSNYTTNEVAWTEDEWKDSVLKSNYIGSTRISGGWRTFITARHRSGLSDGVNYSLTLCDDGMVASNYNSIKLIKQIPTGWLDPVTLWHSGNLPTPLKPGDFGIGGGAALFSGNIDDNTIPSGNYYVSSSATGTKPQAVYGHMSVSRESSGGISARQIWTANNGDTLWVRCYINNTWSTWKSTWNSGNLPNPISVGNYGLGGTTPIAMPDPNNVGQNMFFSFLKNTTNAPSTEPWAGITGGFDGASRWQLGWAMGGTKNNLQTRVRAPTGVWSTWANLWHSTNTTVDANGFLKSASPIARLSSNPEKMPDEYLDGFTLSGLAAVNGEAAGVTAERVSVGVYKVTGSLGFALEGWNIEVPQDVNGNRLCFVATDAAEDGTITVKVSKRRFDIDTAAIVAGEPMDIPEGRWIDLRLEMPPVEEVQSEPEPESHEGEMASE